MNFDEIVVKESPGLCRCCLSEGCYKDLGSEYTWMNDTEVYADMLLDCFDIGITQHNAGPNGAKRLICEVCITRLRDACNFKKQVLDSEKRFIDMLGRGEFRPKVLIYQPQSRQLKAEAAEDTAEEADLTEVEYLEELEYAGDEEVKTEDLQSTSIPTTSDEPEPPKPKRGRPRKEEDKPSKPSKVVKKPKVAKGSNWSTKDSLDMSSDDEQTEPQQPDKRLAKMRENVVQVILNSTILPFRWLSTSYRCFYCYDMFLKPSELKAHNLIHEREEIQTAMLKYWENDVFVNITDMFCTLCIEEFETLNDLIDHLVTNHNIKYDKDTTHCFKTFKIEDDHLICGDCNLSFQLFGQLLIHTTKEHRNPKDHLCDICGRTFKKHQIKQHVHNEHRSKMVSCTQCGEIVSAYALRTHMIRVHNRKIQCKMCKEQFETYYMKQRHMTRVHKSREEFKCSFCPNVFYFKCTMNRHVKEMHLKEKNVMCQVCGWVGFKESRLKAHMLSHSSVRDVPCTICNKKFKSDSYLKQHYRFAHRDEDLDEYNIEYVSGDM